MTNMVKSKVSYRSSHVLSHQVVMRASLSVNVCRGVLENIKQSPKHYEEESTYSHNIVYHLLIEDERIVVAWFVAQHTF